MKMRNICLIAGGVMALCVALAVFFLRGKADGGFTSEDDLKLKSRLIATEPKSTNSVVRISQSIFPDRIMEKKASASKLDVEDMSDLNDDELFDQTVTALYSELLRACQDKDTAKLRKIIEALKKLGGDKYAALSRAKIPVSAIKSKIAEGLGLVGPDAVNEVLDLVHDDDAMVSKSAENALFETLKDLSLGDRRLAEIVADAATELTDEYAITQLYNQFIRMRHSVGCEVFVSIMADGTDQAKAALPRAMGAFTSDISITTAEQLQEWLVDHPDSDWDDRMYGPINKNR